MLAARQPLTDNLWFEAFVIDYVGFGNEGIESGRKGLIGSRYTHDVFNFK